eukprot:s3291_g5.t1
MARLRRISKEATGKDWFLHRGFVVNFRRLMELQKVFAIIHELIKSTAIAALTLVLASDVWQLGYSVMFVVILFMIYGFHAAHYDTMDIGDYCNLVELLEDDNGVCGGRNVDNPNRLLKALSLARTGRRRRAVLIIVLFGLLCSGMWTMVAYSWTMELQDSGMWQIGGEFYATLLLVGTLMFIFHFIFEWLYWRETQCVMPYWNRARKVPWDPVIHGTPHRFRWFGLPSMWFTSSDAYADLSLWIHHAKGHPCGRKVNKVFPEEMALFSLSARNACQLRQSLRHAKLYNVHKASFLTRCEDAKSSCQRLGSLPKGKDPEELKIDFVFYDIQSKEYLQPEEDYTDTQIHVLSRVARVEESVQEGSASSFDLVTEADSSDRPAAEREPAASAASSSEVGTSDSRGRRLLAEEIGRFLRRAVQGEHRGTSGRDKLKLQNRIYVVLANFEGQIFEEPRVETSFAIVKSLCKRGADCGNSIFVGFATKWEARIALEAGRFPEDGTALEDYKVVSLTFTAEGGDDKVVNLIVITAVEGSLLVAVPANAWHKTGARRLLPKGALSKTIKVEVLPASTEEPEVCLAESALKLWVGLLDRRLYGGLEVGASPIADADITTLSADGSLELIPYGPGLVEVADQHFLFLSAISAEAEGEAEVEAADPHPEEPLLEERLKSVEDALSQIQTSLAKLVAPEPRRGESKEAAGESRKASRAGSKKDSAPKKGPLPGLDPAVLSSARAAGIPEEQLRTVSKLVAKSNHMQDAPLTGRKPALRKNVLSETEEEGPAEAESLEETESEGGDPAPIEKAVLQLTRIVGDLAKNKDKRSRDVEALLDGVDGDSAEVAQSGAGKSKAAVYKKLKTCLRDNPKYLYATVLELMEQDFHVLRSAPGSSSQTTSWRAWIEHRSRIGHYPTTIRFCWILGGILDALQTGATAEAQARAALGLLAEDQAALDSGSWVMAQEVLLEEPPPMASFKGKERPEVWEQAASKLLDERWLDVLMWRLKNKDSYLESRKRLGPSKKEWPQSNDRDKEAAPKKKPGGGKGGQKGGGEKGGQNKGSEASPAQQAQIWFSQRARRALRRAPEGTVWPLPLPFAELHLRHGNRNQHDVDRKLGLNFLVLALNSLRFEEKHPRAVMPGLGTKLNACQWAVIKQLTPHVDMWNECPPVGPEEMGRAAAKVEAVEEVLQRLLSFASSNNAELRNYGKRTKGACPAEDEHCERRDRLQKQSSRCVGTMSSTQVPLAKEVEPDRLKFWQTPSFDCSPFLDNHNRETFLFPLEWSAAADVDECPVPRVRVHASSRNKVKLLETLDKCKRMQLLPQGEVRMEFRNGMFSIPKDAVKDRMVLDARPPNALEDGRDSQWINSLGSVAQFNHFFLEEDEVARLFSEDIREFYHAFLISPQRLRRNALAFEVEPKQVAHLQCFRPWMWKYPCLVPCLDTMAMGDCRAVTYGQTAHLSCLLRSNKLSLSDFITLKGRPARRNFVAGLMIDDFILIEKRKKVEVEERQSRSRCEEIIAEVRERYDEVGLPRHPDKAVSNESTGTFWGMDFDGDAGLMRPSLKRSIPVAFIILEMLKLRRTSVGLLEVLAGSLVSIFQCRRRFMSCLQAVYEEQRGRKRTDILTVSNALEVELLQCLALLPLACIDMRLSPSSLLLASDSSPWATAAVATQISPAATSEFQKYGLQKGMWNRLLSPVGAYLREKGLLEAEEELPEKQVFDMHPLWDEIVETKAFAPFGRVSKRKGRQHINLGEVDAALEAEELQGKKEPNSFYVHLQDSQVSLACLVKGRSASKAINRKLKKSIPMHVAQNNRAFYGYVRSKKNPADAPTRSRAVPRPVRGPAAWLREAEKGKFEQLEKFLQEHGGICLEKKGLSEELRKILRGFDRSQFVLAKGFSSLEEAWDSGPGILDLFSGKRGFSHSCVKHASTWTLTFDLAHSESENLLSHPLQEQLLSLISSGAFAAMGAGPVCASFSQAVTPACRTKAYPEGVPWASELQQRKNQMGNEMLRFVLRAVKACLEAAVVFWVENPFLSWMWRQVGELSWDEILADERVGDFDVDYCRFGTPWRKRTKFRTSTHLRGQRCLCAGDHSHVALRGHCKEKGISFTKLAEPYPRGICECLAWAVLADSGLLPERRKIDVNLCARSLARRIGEASNPGPPSRAAGRPNVWLGDVELLEPATVLLRSKIWKRFSSWFFETFDGATPVDWLNKEPMLFVQSLVAYGHFCFSEGVALHIYRQLLAHVQKLHPQVKVLMTPAWETVSKWELQEPTRHRPPVPEPVVLAMTSLALAWDWVRWSAVTLACFYSVSRVGELLRVKRREVLTPRDLLHSETVIYIRFVAPKSRRRGAKVQYSTVEEAAVVPFLCKVWDALQPDELLYAGSQGAYRSRWNALLARLQISDQHKLTPGGLRDHAAARDGDRVATLLNRQGEGKRQESI